MSDLLNGKNLMKSILCVENDYITSFLLQKQIERMGYRLADKVESGEEAIERTQALKPDLVLMDIKLAGTMDGIDAAERISREYKIPVIFVTGHGDVGTRKRAEQIKPVDYLVKPVEMNILQEVINKTFTHVA